MADWYPWYPVLFLADTMHLTPAQDGVYRRLIDWYMTSRRPLPDNDGALASIARIGVSEWQEMAPVIRAFFKSRAGTLYHKRCEIQLKIQDDLGVKRSEIAKKGAEARWGKSGAPLNDLDAGSNADAECLEHGTSNASGNGSAMPRAMPEGAPKNAIGHKNRIGEKKESTNPEAVSSGFREPDYAAVSEEAKIVASAPGSQPTDAADMDAVMAALGHPPSLLNLGMVSSWTRDGCDVKLDVIPTLKAVLARKRKAEPSWTPSTLKFFDQAVRSARDTRAALGPAKPPTNGTGEMILHGDWRDFRYLDSLSIANRVECMTAWGLMNAGKVEVLARADKEGLGVQWRKAQH